MHIVIIAGGVGARLWPVSREANPKPFIRMDDGLSLIQKTFLRAQLVEGCESITTVTNRELYFRTEDAYRELSTRLPLHYVLEPIARNTAPAVCAAALELQDRYGDDALILVLPADHLVRNEKAFVQAVSDAAGAASNGHLVTFGVFPTHIETGFGYIEVGEGVNLAEGKILNVARFVEKPNYELAQEFVAGGRHLWNSGMFCARAGALLDELSVHAPSLVSTVSAALEDAHRTEGSSHTVTCFMKESFSTIESESIDCALLEKSDQVLVLPCDLDWSDIGSWQAMAELVEPDEGGNRVVGEAELENCRNLYIRSPYRLTAAMGIEDLVIVDTADVLLVAQKEDSQNLKALVERLKARGGELHQYHVTVHRPWGTYTVLEEGERFKIKRIEVKPGGTLSLQMHHHRSEHWIVVRGTAKIVKGDRETLLRTNESTYIPAGCKHRLENPGIIPLVMIEVQSGEYLGEDDIVRFVDSYGRN